MPEQRKPLVSAKKIAERLGTSRWQVYSLASRGLLPHVRVGRSVKFDPDVIESFIASGGTARSERAP